MAVTDEQKMLAAVNQSPDDDGPRLAYAEYIANREPDYAEFIRLQVARSTTERLEKVARGQPSSRELGLLETHYGEWGRYIQRYVRDAPVPRTDDQGWQFDRGFIAFVRMEPENFVALGQRLFDLAPVQHADLYAGSSGVSGLFSAPGLAHLDSLSLRNAGLSDDDAVALANCELLRRATWLDLSANKIGRRGVEALAASSILANKIVVDLSENPWDPGDRPSSDGDGSLAWAYPVEEGAVIEQALGHRVAWFHTARLATVPDRYHAKLFSPIAG